MSQPVRQYMTTMPHTIGSDISISTAVKMMREYKCHHLPVLDGGHLVGVISDKDLKMASGIRGSDETKVQDIMTDEPVVVEGQMDVFQVAMLMHQKKIGSVIVAADKTHPWGIFTATDALAFLAKKSH